MLSTGLFREAACSYAAVAYAYSALACAANSDRICFETQVKEIRGLAASLEDLETPHITVLATLALTNATAQLVYQSIRSSPALVEALRSSVEATRNVIAIAALEGRSSFAGSRATAMLQQ